MVPPPIRTIGLPPGLLEPPLHHDLGEVADMEAGRGEIVADIAHEAGLQRVIQPFDVAALVKLPARDDGVEEIGLILAHDARRLA